MPYFDRVSNLSAEKSIMNSVNIKVIKTNILCSFLAILVVCQSNRVINFLVVSHLSPQLFNSPSLACFSLYAVLITAKMRIEELKVSTQVLPVLKQYTSWFCIHVNTRVPLSVISRIQGEFRCSPYRCSNIHLKFPDVIYNQNT